MGERERERREGKGKKRREEERKRKESEEEETSARVRMIGARSADARRLHASSYCCYLCLVLPPLYPAYDTLFKCVCVAWVCGCVQNGSLRRNLMQHLTHSLTHSLFCGGITIDTVAITHITHRVSTQGSTSPRRRSRRGRPHPHNHQNHQWRCCW